MKRVKRTLKPEIGSYSSLALCLPLSALLPPLPPLLLHLHTELCLFPLFSSSSSSSAASTYVDLLLFDIMAKYCIANIFVLLGLAWLASGLAWPALLCSVPLCLSPLSLLCVPLDLFNFLFLLLLFCSALFRRLCQSQSCEAHLTNELCSCFKLLPPTAPSLSPLPPLARTHNGNKVR